MAQRGTDRVRQTQCAERERERERERTFGIRCREEQRSAVVAADRTLRLEQEASVLVRLEAGPREDLRAPRVLARVPRAARGQAGTMQTHTHTRTHTHTVRQRQRQTL